MGYRSVRILIPAFFLTPLLFAGTYDETQTLLQSPPDDARVLMRWWWFGPAVVKPQLEAEMLQMKAAGIGGFEIQPVYPLTLDDPARKLVNLRYLSPEFLELVRFSGEKARQLGLRMDLTIGSGWPFGGPHIQAPLASGQLKFDPEPHAGKTGQQVKRASLGAEGFVLDHYNHEAIDLHLATVGDKLLAAAGPGTVHAAFCDSLEVYRADWTGRLPEEFRKRRNYDLIPYLQNLRAGTAEAASVRHDYGQTLSEVYEDQFLSPLSRWAHSKGVRLRMQNYGTPPATLSSNLLVDLPEGEGWHWRTFTATRWASSASHLFGRAVTSSETWTWVHSPIFRATPLDLKAEADQQFLCGINQLVGHGWPYSPPQAGEPGWAFYAAGALNAHNPWWPVMPDLSRYLQRVSALLRQGEPVADVGLYLPNHDAWASFLTSDVDLWKKLSARVSPVVPAILDAGFNFDGFDDLSIDRTLRRHRVVVLPGVERMPLETLGKLEAFRAAGGTVIAVGRIPTLAPGLKEQDRSPEVASRAEKLLRPGFVPDVSGLGAALATRAVPDLVSPALDGRLGFVHRRLQDADLYFLANTDNRARKFGAEFRTKHASAEQWNALTGEKTVLPIGPKQTIELAAYGTTIIVFSDRGAPAPRTRRMAAEDLSRGWDVAADQQQAKHIETLGWVTATGSVVYRKAFHLKAVAQGPRIFLDLGASAPASGEAGDRNESSFVAEVAAPLREAAEVWVNGSRAGSVWCPPYRVELTRFVRKGSNRLEIRVFPTAMNRMAAQPRTDYTALSARYGKRFDMQDLEKIRPEPTGLIGPVTLLTESEDQ
ncbi:MAG: glycosyl hydrolase [Acidobacteria bacterium]|nr:glycosyl hydrolase [Acidobacteriota bacterium]